MNGHPNCVTDAELQAYVDGLLPSADRPRVESFLSACPEERERIDAYRRQNVQLHRLFDWAAHRPLPRGHEQLIRNLAGRMRRQRYFNNAQRVAAAAMVVMAVCGAGWASYQWLTPERPLLAFSEKGADSYVMLVGDGRPGVATDGGSEIVVKRSAEMLSSLSAEEASMPQQPPDFEKVGFHLIGARTLSTAIGPAIQFLYANKEDVQVTLFLRPNANAGAIASTVADNGGVSMIYSEADDMAYSLVGNVDRKTILGLAALVTDTLAGARPDAPPSAVPKKPRSQPASVQGRGHQPQPPAEGRKPADPMDGPGARGSLAPDSPPVTTPAVIRTGLKPSR